MLRQAELRALYVEARAELRLGHFDTAVGLLGDLLAFDPEYADAAVLRDTALHGQQLNDAYGLGVAAQEAGDWGLEVPGRVAWSLAGESCRALSAVARSGSGAGTGCPACLPSPDRCSRTTCTRSPEP